MHLEPIRFLVFLVSLRHNSLNTRLATLAAECIRAHRGELDLASMADFDCSSYNQDIHYALISGLLPPPGFSRFDRLLTKNRLSRSRGEAERHCQRTPESAGH
jgi:hypothetical protein